MRERCEAGYDGSFEGMQLALVAIEAGEPLRSCVRDNGDCPRGITLLAQCPDCDHQTERIDAAELRADIEYDLLLEQAGQHRAGLA